MPVSFSIPLEAVQLKDGEDMVSPNSGDAISIAIEGSVESIDDGLASINVSSVNGVEVGEAETPESPGADPENPDTEGNQVDVDHEAAKAELLASLEGKEI